MHQLEYSKQDDKSIIVCSDQNDDSRDKKEDYYDGSNVDAEVRHPYTLLFVAVFAAANENIHESVAPEVKRNHPNHAHNIPHQIHCSEDIEGVAVGAHFILD